MLENSESPKTEEPRPRRVLVVEDDEGLNNLAQEALRKAGYDTAGVLNAAEAIERVMANPEVVLLLDIKLPDMTGGEVISALIERNCPVPFIAMTGHGDERTAVEMMKLGADDYLVKGLDLVERLPGAFRRLFHELDTERRLRAAEEALHESEERYRNVVELSPDPILIHIDGKIVYCNPALVQNLGTAGSEELLGRAVLDLLGPEDQDEARERIDKTFHGQRLAQPMIGKVLRSDGKLAYIEAISTTIPYQGKQAVLTVGRDITERKQAEEALRASEERFRGIYEQSPIGIELYDSDRLLINANPKCLDMFGVDNIKEVEGFKLFEDPNLPEDAKQRLRNGEPVKYESQFDFEVVKKLGLYKTSKSGKRFVDVFITPLGLEGGVTGGYLVHVRDITERKLAEEALRKSEERFRNLVETSQDMIWSCDAKGRFTYLNPAWEKLLGYELTEMLGHAFSEFKPPEIAKRDLQTFKHILKGKTTFGYETVYISKSGQHKHLVFNARVLKAKSLAPRGQRTISPNASSWSVRFWKSAKRNSGASDRICMMTWGNISSVPLTRVNCWSSSWRSNLWMKRPLLRRSRS